MQTITLEVSPEIAEAYQIASPAERQQLQKIISLLLKEKNRIDIDFLRKLIDNISDKALAGSFAPEIENHNNISVQVQPKLSELLLLPELEDKDLLFERTQDTGMEIDL